MAKLVLFLKTDVLPREKHTSTRLVELKDLLIIRFYIIFAPKFSNELEYGQISIICNCGCDSIRHRLPRQKEKDRIWLGIRLITHQCHYWTDSSIMLQEIGRNRDWGQKGTGIMKGFGWFCVILGSASFLGAAINGNSVFGPAFWLALGIYLIRFPQ